MTQIKVIKNFAGNISGPDTYHLLLADTSQQIVAQCGKQGDANLLAYLWNKHMEAACPDEGCPHHGTPHSHTDTSKVTVDREGLRQVLQALSGHGHEIRELQATRNLPIGPANPINTLIDNYNEGLT